MAKAKETVAATVSEVVGKNLALAFNEWMRRYTEEPERYAREYQTVGVFLAEQAAGRTPSYGEECAEYLQRILRELHASGVATKAA